MKTDIDITIVAALTVIAIAVLYAKCFYGFEDGDAILGGIVGGFITRLKRSKNA